MTYVTLLYAYTKLNSKIIIDCTKKKLLDYEK